MYSPFFGLSRSPFSAADRPVTTFPGSYKAELTRLVFALQGGQGIVELIVEGAAPTLPVAQHLLDHMPDNCRCIGVLNPRLSQLGFLHAVCQQLAVPLPSKEYSASTLMNLIWDELSDSKQAADTNILVLNDAHLAPSHVLKQIVELSAHAPDEENLLQVVLIGHADLRNVLSLQENQEVAKSITRKFALPALTVADTARYIQQRMENVGWALPLPFDAPALNRIHLLAEGLPERIDAICDGAILKAQALKKKSVTLPILQKALTSISGSIPAKPQLPKPTPGATAPLSPPKKAELLSVAVEQKISNKASDGAAGKRWLGSKGLWIGGFVVVASGLLAGVAFLAAPPKNAATRSEGVPTPTDVKPVKMDEAPKAASTPLEESAAPIETIAETEVAAKTDLSAAVTGEASASPDLATLADGPDDTWPAIGKIWGLKLGGKTACGDALDQGHQCFRSATLDLDGLRDMNRPGLVKLHQGDTERWVQLLEVSRSAVTLASGTHKWQVSLPRFRALWKGSFSTLWRRPPNSETRLYAASVSDPSGEWLDQQLVALQKKGLLRGSAETAQARLEAFQQQQKLPGDGKALPSTFIRINQLAGVAEPRIVK